MTKEEFSRIIGIIKAEEGLIQSKIADILNIHENYLSDMKKGRVKVTKNIQEKIYELFPYTKTTKNSVTTSTNNNCAEVSECMTVDKLLTELTEQRKMFQEIIMQLISNKDK